MQSLQLSPPAERIATVCGIDLIPSDITRLPTELSWGQLYTSSSKVMIWPIESYKPLFSSLIKKDTQNVTVCLSNS